MVDVTFVVTAVISVIALISSLLAWWETRKLSNSSKEELDLQKTKSEEDRKQLIQQQRERQNVINEHVEKLIHQFDLAIHLTRDRTSVLIPSVNSVNLSARNALSSFEYKREMLEHLRTGHGELYVLFTTTKQLQTDALNTRDNIDEEIRKRLNNEAKALALQNGFTMAFPSYKEIDIASYISRRLISETNLKDFETVSKEANSQIQYHVEAENFEFAFCGDDKTTADKFVLALNAIFKNNELLSSSAHYNQLMAQIQSNDKELDSRMDYFIHGKELGGEHLGGACEQCLWLHDEREQPLLKALFSQVDAFLLG